MAPTLVASRAFGVALPLALGKGVVPPKGGPAQHTLTRTFTQGLEI